MGFTDAIILGLVQGITEFLPISSSGHLILVREWLSIDVANALAYDAMLHLATTAAVITYFWSDLWILMQAVLRKLGRLPVNKRDLNLFYALAVGTIPGVVIGLAVEPFFNKDLQSIIVVAAMLFVASVFFMYAEWRYYLMPEHGSVTIRRGLIVGLFQALALIPGFSRSGSTIAGGMLFGMSRYEASRFSFLLAIPITLGLGCKKLLELLQHPGAVDWVPILVGSGVAAVTAFVVIHFFLSFIKNHTLWPFIWYGILMSGFVGYAAFVM